MFNNKYGTFGYFVPFNFFLVLSGLTLAIYASILTVKKLFTTLWSYQYTGFNFFNRLFEWNFDLLATSQVSLIGYAAVFAGILILVFSLIFTRTKASEKKPGILGYLFLFFLYQLWWIGAIVAWIRAKGRNVEWR